MFCSSLPTFGDALPMHAKRLDISPGGHCQASFQQFRSARPAACSWICSGHPPRARRVPARYFVSFWGCTIRGHLAISLTSRVDLGSTRDRSGMSLGSIRGQPGVSLWGLDGVDVCSCLPRSGVNLEVDVGVDLGWSSPRSKHYSCLGWGPVLNLQSLFHITTRLAYSCRSGAALVPHMWRPHALHLRLMLCTEAYFSPCTAQF